MTNDRPSELLGQLPRTRPHRRSTKRPARAGATAAPAKASAPAESTAPAKEAAPAKSTGTHARATSPAKSATGAKGRSQTAKRPTTKAPAATKSTAATTMTQSSKRGAPAARPRTERLSQPAQPRGVPAAGRTRRPSVAGEASPQPDATPILRTALQAAGEIAEIGLVLSSRALRRALERLPRA